MAYSSGTITSANPAADLYAAIVTAFDAHDNWDIIENVVISSVNHQVWRNNGTGTGANDFGTNFYIALIYNPTGGTTLDVKAFESYDSSLDKLVRPCVPVSSSLTPNANTSFGPETLSSGYTLDNTAVMVYARLATVTTGFDYYIQVSENRLCVATKFSTTDNAFYAGIFESLLAAGSEPFPLCVIGTTGQENAIGTDMGVSRHPGKTVAASNNFKFQLTNWSAVSGTAEQNDLMHGAAVASRALIRGIDADAATYGGPRGLLYDCVYLPDGTTATRNGALMQIGVAPSQENWRKFKFGTFGLSSGVWVKESAA